MAAPILSLTTKELSKKTWPDFEKLFSQGNGWDFCWCMHFQRASGLPRSKWLKSRAQRGKRNRKQKLELVELGRAHGILVYAKGEPVGWCQFGPKDELSRIDSSKNYRGKALEDSEAKLWRITCFVVDKEYRRRGIARVALKAALDAIRKRGGGTVEAYPMIPWEELCRERIRRCGHAPSFGNESTHGTKSMFDKEGFGVVAAFGNRNVLMRRKL
jgi:GNAT superfamily N-acetyltransferase